MQRNRRRIVRTRLENGLVRQTQMTPENAIELLRAEQANDDTEAAHINADEIICKLLSALGYQDVVHEYDKVNKWFS